jgi:hypothetical protein
MEDRMEDPLTTYRTPGPAYRDPPDAWEEFFALCLEWAETARQRRAEIAPPNSLEPGKPGGMRPGRTKEKAVPETKGVPWWRRWKRSPSRFAKARAKP